MKRKRKLSFFIALAVIGCFGFLFFGGSKRDAFALNYWELMLCILGSGCKEGSSGAKCCGAGGCPELGAKDPGPWAGYSWKTYDCTLPLGEDCVTYQFKAAYECYSGDICRAGYSMSDSLLEAGQCNVSGSSVNCYSGGSYKQCCSGACPSGGYANGTPVSESCGGLIENRGGDRYGSCNVGSSSACDSCGGGGFIPCSGWGSFAAAYGTCKMGYIAPTTPPSQPTPIIPPTQPPSGCENCSTSESRWCAPNASACYNARGRVIPKEKDCYCSDPNTVYCCTPQGPCPAQVNVEGTYNDCTNNAYVEVKVRQDPKTIHGSVDCGCAYSKLDVKITSSPAGSGIPYGYVVCSVGSESCKNWSSCFWNIRNMQDAPDSRATSLPVGPYPAGHYVLEVFYGGHTPDEAQGNTCSDPMCAVSDDTTLGTCPIPTQPPPCLTNSCPTGTNAVEIDISGFNPRFENYYANWEVNPAGTIGQAGDCCPWDPEHCGGGSCCPNGESTGLCSTKYAAGGASPEYNISNTITGLKANTNYLVGVSSWGARGSVSGNTTYQRPNIKLSSGNMFSAWYVLTDKYRGSWGSIKPNGPWETKRCLWYTGNNTSIKINLASRGSSYYGHWGTPWGASFDNLRLWECQPICQNSSPAAPELSSPTNGATCQDTSPTLRWNSVNFGKCCSSQNNRYRLYYKRSNDASYTEGCDTTSTSCTLSNLSYNTTYNWYVRAENGCPGSGTNSSVWSFTTKPSTPAAPSGLNCSANFSSCATAPAGGSSVSLSWDSNPNVRSFDIYHNDVYLGNTPFHSYTHPIYCNRDRHSYKVQAKTDCNIFSSFSSPCTVQCADTKPAAVDGNYLSPRGGISRQDDRVILSWRDIGNNHANWGLNCTGNNDRYIVYLCKEGPSCSDGNVPETAANKVCDFADNDASTLYCPSGLNEYLDLDWESTYHWKVVTSNGAQTASSPIASFKITYPSAWWQTKTGDVYGNNIFSPIWREATSPYFSLVGLFGSQSGLVAAPNCLGLSGARCNFGAAQATQTEFLTSGRGGINANFTPLLNDYSYDQLAHLVDLAIKDDKQESYNSGVKVIKSDKINKVDLVGASAGLYYYPPYGTDDMAVSLNDDNFSIGANQKLVIFVEDNLNINKNISVTSGGFLAFVVKGNINIASNVTQVQGVYFTDRSLTVESNGAADNQFEGQGIFVPEGGAFLKRNFRSGANATTPAEIFTFDPAYLFTAPKVFREKPYLWQEVIP